MDALDLTTRDKRRQARFPIGDDPVTVDVDGVPYALVDASRGGLAIETIWPLPVGQRCSISIHVYNGIVGDVRHVTKLTPVSSDAVAKYRVGLALVDETSRDAFSNGFWEAYLDSVAAELEAEFGILPDDPA